ncbi:hypothetical protein PISMIDRAFT_681742 [Pisolithus microcarpus 441]|uniref:Uncharacterized protein n=1 Tax=Pisolithus microcarpus 441 TaxID=765257 RepID=A0A0C9Y8R6_9AGAM|nr:hypothetical protein PISMIDRAFT_681742 [Pisolithus microcarpus 441]
MSIQLAETSKGRESGGGHLLYTASQDGNYSASTVIHLGPHVASADTYRRYYLLLKEPGSLSTLE